MKRIVLVAVIFILTMVLPVQADELDEFAGIWSVAKLNGGAEFDWAKKYGGWLLFLEIKKIGKREPTIGMYYLLRSGLIPVPVFDAHLSDGALVVMTTFKIPGESLTTETQYIFPFKTGKQFGAGDYYAVHEIFAGPDGETNTESVSGSIQFKKQVLKK